MEWVIIQQTLIKGTIVDATTAMDVPGGVLVRNIIDTNGIHTCAMVYISGVTLDDFGEVVT